ncbi:MAG: hypothetical protein K0U72_04945 [Gammaproteobacteria bacterium]|nr:hypothetical protein [Gammaproteobacteria bacterium]
MSKNIEITRPLKHRPGVAVVSTNGRSKILGDGDPLSSAEYFEAIGGYPESTAPKLEFNSEERELLQAAESKLSRARAAEQVVLTRRANVERRGAVLENKHAADHPSVQALIERRRTYDGRLVEVRDVLRLALVEYNHVNGLVTRAARTRLDGPPQLHRIEPTLDERIEALEIDDE